VAFAGIFGGGGGGSSSTSKEEPTSFTDLFSEAQARGECSVQRVAPFGGTTFYVPRGGDGDYNILAWGNGTGGNALTYSSMLERLASHCILVAAANTANAGSGRPIEDAVEDALSRYDNILADDPVVCTSGHSQGGGGSFNAARLLDADCVISVQADTVFTTQIDRRVDLTVDVIALWSSADALAPRLPFNDRNGRDASTSYVSIETRGEGHFAPVAGTGGDIGVLQRMAAIAQLSTDADQRRAFRGVFYGPETISTVDTSNRDISYVSRNSIAVGSAP